MQYEITEAIPLLDEKGNLTKAGYAKKLLPVYDRNKVKGGKTRLKEWDYYYVGNDQFGVALTIADNSYMGLDSISFLWFGDEPWEITKGPIRLFPMGKTNLPSTSTEGVTSIFGKGYEMVFRVEDGKRTLTAHMDDFKDGQPIDIHITLMNEPEESMVICTPFEKEAHFYYNQKINCLPAEGWVEYDGVRYNFDPHTDFGTLDWGRGVWTYDNYWYWGSGSGYADGKPVGFNIGYGFGDTTAASENMLFYDGKCHKLDDVTFNIPKSSYTDPWTFTSSDGRFEMDFVPILDRAAKIDVKFIITDQHQVFGRLSGKAVLDDGTVLEIKDCLCFAEDVHNKY
jgi:hypothetical protein